MCKKPSFLQDFRKNSISLKTEGTANNFPLKTGKYRQNRLHSLQNYHTSGLQTRWSDKISGNQSKNCENARKKAQKWAKIAHFYKISCIFSKSTGFSANIKRPKSHCIGLPNCAKKSRKQRTGTIFQAPNRQSRFNGTAI